MITNKEILTSILKTAQMGQIGIRSTLECAICPALRKELNSQLREYDTIESEAHAIASRRGWALKELDPAVRSMTDMMTRMRASGKNTDSKAAAMMINGSTKGMIKGLRNIHSFSGSDSAVSALSQKLLDTETANIRQLQGFL